MAATFVALGIAAGLSGKAFGTALSSPVIPLVLAFFFIALALSMFGAFEIALPPALALRLNQVGGAGFAGAFSMGLVAGLIAAPCTGPVLLGILAYVATHQSVALGSFLLFLYALGVGAPFFVIGVFSFNLGRSGPWMDAVKSVVGVVLLIMAVFEIRLSFPNLTLNLPAIPGIVFVIAGLVAAGVLMGAIHRSFHDTAGGKALKIAGLALVILGFTARLDVESVALAQTPGGVAWVKDLDKALTDAKAAHQPVFVDFYADWCAACKELDRKTYPDPAVRTEAKRFIAVKVDGTHESDALDKIYDRYKVEGLPTVIFIASDGTLVKDQRVIGFVEPAEMLALLKKVN
jgi:thiol:disulfide interchange protein DsbD